jgi:hypothetical protein
MRRFCEFCVKVKIIAAEAAALVFFLILIGRELLKVAHR